MIINKSKKKKKKKKNQTNKQNKTKQTKKKQKEKGPVEFAVSADHRVKLKESEKRDNYLDLARELKKTMEHESDGDTNCNSCARYSYQRIGAGNGVLRNKRTSADHPNYCIIKIDQNTEKSPGALRRLAVTQTALKNH